MMAHAKIDNALVGAAGVHYVAAILSMKGFIALPTIRNAPGIDLVVVNLSGSWHANIQVKTSQYKVNFWPISNRFHEFSGPNNYYAFVRYINDSSLFEVVLETADKVIQDADIVVADTKARGLKEWAPSWYLPHDPDGLHRVLQQWENFGLISP
jgi:hypothetical protein